MTTAPERTALSPDQVASRLISGSVRRSYEPAVAIDWDAPLEEGKYFLPKEVISLYGTAYWEELTEEQRIALSREELANVLSVGLWFENILNRGLLLQLLREDPTSPFAHYVLTEMGDECRHMTMFGKVIDRVGARPYRMGRIDRFLAAALPHFLRGLAAVGRRADRRGDLRRAAAPDHGRPRPAAGRRAADADPRHRGGPAHQVRAGGRRPPDAGRVLARAVPRPQPQRAGRAGAGAVLSSTAASTTGPASTSTARSARRGPTSTTTRWRSSGSRRWPPSSRRTG